MDLDRASDCKLCEAPTELFARLDWSFESERRLGMERTQALRLFKAATGMTFRAFKLWSGLQHAARQIEAGVIVRIAAIDAGFAGTAHLSRSFRARFGLSPSAAIEGLSAGGPR